MDENEPQKGISRRRALKRIGVATGVAWATPIVTSIRTPAFAGTPVIGCQDQDFSCGDITFCGEGSNLLDCFCEKGSSGTTICVNDMFCEDLVPCTADSGCPPGWICASDTCCGTVCLPPCGQAPASSLSAAPRESSRTAAGR